jgi:hypothetical protein
VPAKTPAKVHGGVAQQVKSAAPSKQRSRVRASPSPRKYHAPVVKRRSCRITDPAVGVRVPPGALHARLAQWESARFTPARRHRFDSFAEHGGRSSTGQSAGPWSRRPAAGQRPPARDGIRSGAAGRDAGLVHLRERKQRHPHVSAKSGSPTDMDLSRRRPLA